MRGFELGKQGGVYETDELRGHTGDQCRKLLTFCYDPDNLRDID
jgi:hypothetical protein